MTSDTRRIRSTEELASANIGGEMPQSLPQDRFGTVEGEQRKLLQRQIDQAMLGAIADTRRPNPITGNGSPPTVRVGGAAPVVGARGTGWRDTGPLRPVATPLAEAVITAMTHQHQPHSPGNSAFRGPKRKEGE
jgi:hypothetical protein